ncbi:hypothetical protein U9M48_014506 [Paspalum notatum var. saurae]|uniref:Protein TIFY n=1 Tax=Paspalum notatum var. saurae TaxID=547442 RepID=A0AAQ3T1U2_PASNO
MMGREVEEPQGAAAAMAQAGRAPARDKSSFAATCSLLSQYLRDNKAGLQGLGGLAMAPAAGALRPPTTMNLLSALDAPAQEPAAAEGKDHDQRVDGNPREAAAAAGDETRQLTIFYAGKVVVFDKFPSTKVQDLLQIANAGGDAAEAPAAPNSLPDMPIARRNSLHRFLAKRKDRITAKAPYQVVNNSSVGVEAPKQTAGVEKPKPWLGLGQEVTVKQEI